MYTYIYKHAFSFLVVILSAGLAHAGLGAFANPGLSLTNADAAFLGEGYEHDAGFSVANAGDIDGDGRDDLLIGADDYSYGTRTSCGAVYLMWGSNVSYGAETDLANADILIVGEDTWDSLGLSVASAGDVDGDGLSDILVGSPYNTANQGKAYLLFGSNLITKAHGSVIDLASEIGIVHFTGQANDTAGRHVSSAGDVDGDGRDDILVGAPLNSDGGRYGGKSYLLYATTILADDDIDLGSESDLSFSGGIWDDSGRVAKAGDIDGDGLDDILIGARWNEDTGYIYPGKICVFLASSLAGEPAGAEIPLTDADYAIRGVADYTYAGESLAGAGDVDGDGHADLLIGTTHAHNKVYLFSGSSLMAGASTRDITEADYIFEGADQMVAPGGDMDGDGRADILIAEYVNSDAGLYAGKSFLFRSALLHDVTNDVANADYIFEGENAGDESGYSLAMADVDNDGMDDVVVGAPFNDQVDYHAGKVYLILSDIECLPTNTVYVDADNGWSGAPGGAECPVALINEGIQIAASLGITQVVVNSGGYYEDVSMSNGVSVVGQITTTLPPMILSANFLQGASAASLKYFWIWGGGLNMNGVTNMSIIENLIYRTDNQYVLSLTNGSSQNLFENNLVIQESRRAQALAYLSGNCRSNYFINNTFHKLGNAGIAGSIFSLNKGAFQNEFRNNILHYTTPVGGLHATGYGFNKTFAAGANTIEYNLTPANNRNVTVGASNLVGSNPRFGNPKPAGTDYDLRAASPCIDTGDSSSAYNDLDGTVNDMGCFGGPNALDYQP